MRTKKAPPISSFLVAALILGILLPASALASRDYPPRISEIDGSAAYMQAGAVDWDEVTVNLPLLTGDRIFTHQGSRVEIDLGKANFVRIDSETDLAVLDADSKETRLELRAGALILRMNDSERFRIFTPTGSIYVNKKGLYRINVDPAGVSEVYVRKGKLEVETAQGSRTLKDGQSVRLDGSGAGLRDVAYGYAQDQFDLWSDRRDARFVSSRSVAYVGGVHYPGVWDLDYYGDWYYYPAYGRVWVPRVSVGWVPFRVGRWGHYSFGWTWISYEPWGWLPYHYGSWTFYSGRWCWVPGGFHAWSPAIVSFYYGNGYIGWAPRYHPRYYGGNTVIVNNTTIINNYDRRGMTVVRSNDFGTRVPVSRVAVERPDRVVTSGFRSGLPQELKDPAVIRNRTMVRDSNGAVPGATGRRDLGVGNSLTGTDRTRTPVRIDSTSRPGSTARTPSVTRTGERAPDTSTPARVITTRPATRSTPSQATSPGRERTRIDSATPSPTQNRTVTPGNRSVDPGSRSVVPGSRRVAPETRSVDPGSQGSRSVVPGNRSVDPSSQGTRSVVPGNRSVDPSSQGTRSVAPGNRSVAPAQNRSVLPSQSRSSVAPTQTRSTAEPSRNRVTTTPTYRYSTPARDISSTPTYRRTTPSAPSQSIAPTPSRSATPSSPNIVRPSPTRTTPSVSRAPSRPSSNFSRPSSPPQIQRSAPQIQRSAPQIQRSAPQIQRSAPQRSAPQRSASPPSRPRNN